MYSQRRYGGSVNRGQPVPKGQQDSRQNRNNNSIRGKSTAAIAPNRNIGPAKSPHTTPHKKEDKIEKEVKTTDNKDSQLGEEGQLISEDYIESDVIGFDDNIGQPSPGQKAVNNTSKQQVMDRPKHQTDNRKQNESVKSTKINESPKPMFQPKQQAQSNREIKKEDNFQQNVDLKEDSFGLVRIAGKRLLNLDSLILPNEKKHSGRSRLFIANLASGVNEADLKELFEKFGDATEIFVNKDKGFGFVRLDYKINAEIAKNALDGYIYKGRPLRVKFAAHQSAIEIHGIDRFTSNESLEAAFSMFGVVERATVICDERGRSKGYAVIEFAYKKSAQSALNRINEGLFVLGRLPKPVTAKPLTQLDDEGIHEKDLERIPGLGKDREYKARFVTTSSPEYGLAKRWRELEEEGRTQRERLEKQLEDDQQKMEFDFEAAVHDQEAEYVRQELLQKQAALEEEIRRHDEMRNRESVMIRQQGQNFERRLSDMGRTDDRDMQFRGMPSQSSNMGLGGLGPTAALAMAARSNILQAIKGQDQMGGGNQRMPGPRGGPIGPNPRGPGIMGLGSMQPPRPLFDARPGPPRGGNSMSGARRPGNRDNSYSNSNKRPRK